jgi:hypothetical protein
MVNNLTDRSTKTTHQSRDKEDLKKSAPATRIPVLDLSSPVRSLTIVYTLPHHLVSPTAGQVRSLASGIS